MSAYTRKGEHCTYALCDKGQEGLEHGWYFTWREVDFDLIGEVQQDVYRISPTISLEEIRRCRS